VNGSESRPVRLPRLIDQYNDVLRASSRAVFESERGRTDPSLREYQTRLGSFDAYLREKQVARPLALESPKELEQVWQMCLHGLDYFVVERGAHIHFVLSTFDAERNRATRLELEHIARHPDRFQGRVSFYRLKEARLVRVGPPALMVDLPLRNPQADAAADAHRCLEEIFSSTRQALEKTLSRAPFAATLQPAWNGRIKSVASRNDKYATGRPLDDLFGFRLSHPYTAPLYTVAAWLAAAAPSSETGVRFTRQVVWEGGKIIYLYGHTLGTHVSCEVQLWPSIYLAAFQSEHDAIYKKASSATAEALAASAVRRQEQHALQRHVDARAVFLRS
jgi:hypothetical protein